MNLLRRGGHHHRDAGAGLHQLADQGRRLVRRDAAGHDADDQLAGMSCDRLQIVEIELRRTAGPLISRR